MGAQDHCQYWQDILEFPLIGREQKPRSWGLTMVIDKGLGINETKGLLETAAPYVEFIKLGFGTSALYSTAILQEKIDLVKSYGVDIYPGGTFLELAALQGKLSQFIAASWRLGYTCIEVSDGTINMDQATRRRAIMESKDLGFKVFSEVGKKDPRDRVSTSIINEQIALDLQWGADWVIVEGRESGQGVVIYDEAGKVKDEELQALEQAIFDPRLIVWEAPHKHQQQALIERYGNNVNLGNIQPHELLALEALRLGLRGDTLRTFLFSPAGADWLKQHDSDSEYSYVEAK